MSDLSFASPERWDTVDVKGLRFNQIRCRRGSPSSQAQYEGTNEQEVLPERWLEERVSKRVLQLVGLKSWYRRGFETIAKADSRRRRSWLVKCETGKHYVLRLR